MRTFIVIITACAWFYLGRLLYLDHKAYKDCGLLTAILLHIFGPAAYIYGLSIGLVRSMKRLL